MKSLTSLLMFAALAAAQGLPSADAVIDKYVRALGGEEALQNLTSRGAGGSFHVPSYGAFGTYEEYAKAPNQFVRKIHIARGYGVIQQCFDGRGGWTETPEKGVEQLTGERLAAMQRAAAFHPVARIRGGAASLTVAGRTKVEERDAIELVARTAAGAVEKFAFDEQTGLLLRLDLQEIERDGFRREVSMYYENYRHVNGVQVAHTIRSVSAEAIWIANLTTVLHNVPIGDAPFRQPAN